MESIDHCRQGDAPERNQKDKEKRLDKNGKAKLKDLEDKLSKILDTKKVKFLEEKKKFDPTFFIHYLNANYGDESSANEDSDDGYSDDDDKASEGSEKHIPLPPGKPPSNESDNDLPELPPGTPPKHDDSDDDLPELPPGPPPSLHNNDGNAQSSGISRSPPFGFRSPSMPAGPQYPPPQRQGAPLRPLDSRPPPFSVNKVIRDHMKNNYSIDSLDSYGSSQRAFPQPIVTDKSQPMNASLLKSTTTATPVIQAEPQVRNLQKELTTLVPAALLRKKADARKPKVARPVVNAAPNIDDGIGTSTSSVKRNASIAIPLLQQQTDYDVQSSEQKQPVASTSSPAKKAKTKKKVDEYDKFMAEMQDLL
ncbi:5194_t:CDS:2 [Racocetra fulgida]|uniref:5194_t:CDS:1 n=1 Tax=Racocetra fulgida TaxID=60492 RepID=A0A9N8ZRP4_9GLOM|nr:5194_t:CDS:2 [Racocetra fulgida]